ncbi:hypothetical protein Pint_10252 [Pistacia integerrima]|uniref:Uncharacterized protein n=1 Tax=Pistacia integerrima TaxID=434235 RepID=A0ACC0XFP3_9ROSI|nr:hypothetical protein Pint_10252 [Pistacia integerrima]
MAMIFNNNNSTRIQEEAQPQTFLQINRGLDLPLHLHMISNLFNKCIRNLTSMEDLCPLNSKTISLNPSGSYSVYIMILEFNLCKMNKIIIGFLSSKAYLP